MTSADLPTSSVARTAGRSGGHRSGPLHLLLRTRHPLFGPTEIAGFADCYLAALGRLAACTRVGASR
jgi:hypothetical protein